MQIDRPQVTILTVDDEASVLAELAATLTSQGYACHSCSTIETALQLAARVLPDLVISDINIGGESGLQLCEQMRRMPGLSEVPVMFLSGAQIPDIIRRAHAAGGTYYLRKPFDPQVLLELVDKALWMPHLVASHLQR